MDRGAWRATVHEVTRSWTRLSKRTTTESPWSEAGSGAELSSRRGKWCLTLAVPRILHKHILSSQGGPRGVVSVQKHRPAALLSGVERLVSASLASSGGDNLQRPPTPGREHTCPQGKSGSSGTGRMKGKAGRLHLHVDRARPRGSLDSLETCPGRATW